MKIRTRQLAQEVREALVALPDTLLMKTLHEWFDLAGEHMVCLEWADEFKVESYINSPILKSLNES